MMEPSRTEAAWSRLPTAGDVVPTSWNETAARYPTGLLVHEVIRAAAERSPEAVALVFDVEGGRAEMTYREMDRRASRLAGRLRARGAGPDVPVGVHLERSPALVVSLLAVLKAGGAYLALDPEHPPARLGFMMADSGARLVVSRNGGAGLGEVPAGVEVLAPDEDGGEEDVAGEPRGAAPGASQVAVSERNLAYVLYTSGSTGQPKGVMTEHRSIMNRLFWMQDAYPLQAADAVLQKTPFGFDVSVWEFFWPLMQGARLVLARPGGHMDPAYLADLIHREGVTVLHFVPSMLELFLEQESLQERCGSVRHVIASGEALPYALTRRFYQRMPGETTLHNLYGPTEAAVDVSHWTVPRAPWEDRVVPIGRPVSNTRLYVLDAQGLAVGVGTVGELHIGGVQVARGYLNRAALTASQFLTDPFVRGPENRLYKTGDRARWRPDGTLEYLGRLDRQVKVRGQRIELSEVEAALLGVEGVRTAAVIVDGESTAEARLVAYVVPETGGEASVAPAELRRALRARLPEGWIPSLFLHIDTMPLNLSGKLDRRGLPAAGGARPTHVAGYRSPRDGLESYLAGLWARVLGLDRVGLDDPFFELGGTSLQAARIVNEIREALGSFVYVATLFEAPTVAAYAELLRREYAPFVAAHHGWSEGAAASRPAEASGPGAGGTHTHLPGPPGGERPSLVDEPAIARFLSCVPRHLDGAPDDQGREPERPNPPAVFVLAPPRSGTTLLRLMLAGHPDLFAASELQLLNFVDLGQRERALQGRHGAWLEGFVRSVMELTGSDADRAWRIHQRLSRRGLPTWAAYRLLQRWAGDGRMVVDKTPAYALDPAALQKAERDFREPLYIHLVRHPRATVRSFVDQHIHQVLYLKEHAFTPEELGELVWVVSHRNIDRFLRTIPEERKVRLRFEDLVTEPRASMELLCGRLGIPFHPGLLAPYENMDRKMTDGVRPESTPMGDPNVFLRTSIDPSVAGHWQAGQGRDFLGEPAWALAETLGYGTRPPSGPTLRIEEGPAPARVSDGRPARVGRNLRLEEQARRLGARRGAGEVGGGR